MTLNELCNISYEISASKGWHNEPHDPTVRLMLVVTELCEAVEEFRKGHAANHIYFHFDSTKPEGVPIEIADAFIRLGDFCKEYSIDITEAVRMKQEYNKTRTLRHGGRKF